MRSRAGEMMGKIQAKEGEGRVTINLDLCADFSALDIIAYAVAMKFAPMNCHPPEDFIKGTKRYIEFRMAEKLHVLPFVDSHRDEDIRLIAAKKMVGYSNDYMHGLDMLAESIVNALDPIGRQIYCRSLHNELDRTQREIEYESRMRRRSGGASLS